MKDKVFLIDIDGTISDDIKNEDSHLYPDAKVIPGARECINEWYENGSKITFFTARNEKDRKVTEIWLKDNGFKYHSLIMDKPRINDGQDYVWIDNRPVYGIVFKNKWKNIKKKFKRVFSF
jgi:uncharacterized HAD superfamily protein